MGLPSKTKWEDKLYEQIVVDPWIFAVPQRNHVGAIPGRKFEFDLWFEHQRIGVEVQGGVWSKKKMGHGSGSGIARDCTKIVLAQIAGIFIIPVTSDHIRDGTALDWIKQAIAMRSSTDEKARPQKDER